MKFNDVGNQVCNNFELTFNKYSYTEITSYNTLFHKVELNHFSSVLRCLKLLVS